MKRNTPDHPKIKRLVRALRMPVYSVVGLMELLWHWTAEQCPQGDIGRFTDADIADAVYWPVESAPEDLIKALVDCRLVDHHPEHRLIIHDWSEHADFAVHSRLHRAKKRFADGTEPKATRISKAERKHGEEEAKTDDVRTKQPNERTACAQTDEMSARRAHGERTASALRTRAWPEPEPEPEPAAAPRAMRAREDPDAAAAALAAVVSEFTAGELPPDNAILADIIGAAPPGTDPMEIAIAISAMAKRRHFKAESYGFWPKFVRESMGKKKPPPGQRVSRCKTCHGDGKILTGTPTGEMTMAELDALWSPCPDCKSKPQLVGATA